MFDFPGSASSLRSRAAQLDALADRIDAEARALPDRMERVRGRLGDDVWRGPAATALADAVRAGAGRLQAEGAALSGVARRLRTRADGLRAEARSLDEAQREARRRIERERQARAEATAARTP